MTQNDPKLAEEKKKILKKKLKNLRYKVLFGLISDFNI